MFFRKQACPEKCGSCCVPVSLDYYPGSRWEIFKEKYPDLIPLFLEKEKDGIKYYSHDNVTQSNKCRFLTQNGRCLIHDAHPFLCDFEPRKINIYKDKIIFTKKLLSRAWHLKKVTSECGISCSWNQYSNHEKQHDICLLKEFKEIFKHFKEDVEIIDKISDIVENHTDNKTSLIQLK